MAFLYAIIMIGDMMFVKGKYERKIYRNDENGFTVGIISIKETDLEKEDNIIFTGYFPEIIEQEMYFMEGEIIDHSKYGEQLSVKNYEKLKIETKEKLIEYLSSDLFPGIGKKIAKKIVDEYGMDAIKIILDDKNTLIKLNINQKKINSLYENLQKYEESHTIIVALTEMGFSMKEALKIYNTYGTNTILHIENNIYALIDDVNDLSFVKIDKLREKFKIDKNSDSRIEAGIIYTMKNFLFQTGDSYMSYEEIGYQTQKLLEIEISNLDQFLENLELEGRIIRNKGNFYLFDYYEAECNIRDFFKTALRKKDYEYKNIDAHINELERDNRIIYNDLQKEAIKKGVTSNALIITGGPGVGKTTIVRTITELFKNLEVGDLSKIALLAPTGRASKRLSEATKLPAMTIHRFLKWNKETDQFMMNEYNKSEAKFVIVDETSMIDLLLFDNLLKALNQSVRLIMVGDYFQLPSVSPGQILKDLIESEYIPKIELNTLYRQKEDSFIPTLASFIKNGEVGEFLFEKHSDYNFIELNEDNIVEGVIQITQKIMGKGYKYSEFQIMAPMYKGKNGIDNLNKELQKLLNPSKGLFEIRFFDAIFRKGDKVIQLINIPDESIYNGDIGIIEDVISERVSESGKNEIHVNYDGTKMKYLPSDFHTIRHAYAISIHKSQGSEFKYVVMPICRTYKRMLYRKLIYTGITRAKSKLFLIGDKEAFIYSIKNNSANDRRSTLKERICDLWKY